MMESQSLNPNFANKNYSIYLKLLVLLFLLGVNIWLYCPHLFDDSSLSASGAKLATAINSHETHLYSLHQDPVSPSSTELHKEERRSNCDLFKGEWVRSPDGVGYDNYTCPFVEGHQNCMKNGRPDTGYLYWRWKPTDCELPVFDPRRFLDLMRNKSWAFIGDSISRNHVQSMLCLLSKAELPKEIYHDEQYRSKTWIFPSHNFTLAVFWSPFLVKADVFEDNNGVSTSEIQLHLDKIDEKWTNQYRKFDYVTIAGGKWFLKTAIYYENNRIRGCHYCPGRNLTELGFDYAYRKVLQLVLNFITSSSHKAVVFFRTLTPDHFENGEWHNGGTCPRRVPFKENEVNKTFVDSVLYGIELEEFGKANTSSLGSERGIELKLLNTTQLSLLRPDGHPGPYRHPYPFAKDKNAKVQNDCLHWCLPGPIDSWNDLIMETLMRS